MQRIEKVGDVTLGFERLAIMGLTEEGMQPFSCKNNKVVCNGEIYGFRKIKKELEKEYEFKSDSDCEILLPLYEKYADVTVDCEGKMIREIVAELVQKTNG